MTAAEWLEANPPTHTCRLLGGTIRPDHCKRRKDLAQQPTMKAHPNPNFYSAGISDRDVLMSLQRCIECKGPVRVRKAKSIK